MAFRWSIIEQCLTNVISNQSQMTVGEIRTAKAIIKQVITQIL